MRKVLKEWLEANPDGLLEDGPLPDRRETGPNQPQRVHRPAWRRYREDNVVELKRDRTPLDVIAQAVECAAFAARLDVDALAHSRRGPAQLGRPSPRVLRSRSVRSHAFNKDQRIVMVGQSVPRGAERTV